MSAYPTSGPRRLLIVSDTLAGGMGALVCAHAEWFAAHAWDVVVAAPADGPPPGSPATFVPVPAVRSTRAIGEMMRAGRALRAVWREHGAPGAVVHVHGMRSFLLARLAGLPKPFVSVHGAHPSADDPVGYRAVRKAWFRVIPRLARGATTGEPRPESGWTFTPFASPLLASLDVLPFPGTDSPPTFVWLGLLDDRKQPEVFVRAMAGAPGARGVLAGDGPRAAEIAALIRGLDAPVEMVGHADAVPLLKQAWALCLFAKSEGTPLAVMEAMWAGRTVIGSDLPGVRHLVGDTGVLGDDVAVVAAAITELVDDHALAARRGAAAAARIRTLISPDTPWAQLERSYTA